jgi:hypothetical protein
MTAVPGKTAMLRFTTVPADSTFVTLADETMLKSLRAPNVEHVLKLAPLVSGSVELDISLDPESELVELDISLDPESELVELDIGGVTAGGV